MLRVLRTATVGGSEPPNCRFQISDFTLQIARAAGGHRGMQNARQTDDGASTSTQVKAT